MLVLTVAIFPRKGQLYAVMHGNPGPGWTTHVEEGLNGVVLANERGPVVFNYINGLGHGARGTYYSMAFYRRAIEAISFARQPDDVLVIGFGTGYITEVAVKSRDVKSITLVELNRALLTNLQKMQVFRDILGDPRVDLVVEDGRRYLAQNDRKYDVILMDPLRSTTAYSNNLYSREFFQSLKAHLKPGGVVMVWLDEVRVLPNTVLSVFENMRMYEAFVLASDGPVSKDAAREAQMLSTFPPADREIITTIDHFTRDETVLRREFAGLPINRDWEPVSEYYLGLPLRLASE